MTSTTVFVDTRGTRTKEVVTGRRSTRGFDDLLDQQFMWPAPVISLVKARGGPGKRYARRPAGRQALPNG